MGRSEDAMQSVHQLQALSQKSIKVETMIPEKQVKSEVELSAPLPDVLATDSSLF